MTLDRHAIREAAKLLEEQAVALAFVTQREGCEQRLANWIRRSRRLRGRTVQLMHIEEMARRLRRMLAWPKQPKGASRRKRRPAMTRKT